MNEDSKAKIRTQLINLTQNKKTVKKVRRIGKIICKPVMLECICIIESSSIGKTKKKAHIRERCPKFTATCKENVKEMLNEIVKLGRFHNKRWKKTSRQRRLFKEGGCQLTQALLKNIEPLRQPYLGPVAQTLVKGGCWLGEFADEVIKALISTAASAIDAAGRPAPGPPGIGGPPPGVLARPPPGTGARPSSAGIPRPPPGIGGRPPPGTPPPSSPPTPPSQTPPSQTPPVPPTPPGLQVGDDSIQNVTTLKPTVANNVSPDPKNTTPNIGGITILTKSPQQGNTSDVGTALALGRTSRAGRNFWSKNKKTLKNSCKCRKQMQRSRRTRDSRKDRKKKMKICKVGSKRLGRRNMKQNAKVTRKLQKKTSTRSGPARKRRQEKFLHRLKHQMRHAKPRQNEFKNGKQSNKGKNKRRFKSQTNAWRTKCWSPKRKIGSQPSGGWPCSKRSKGRKKRSRKERRQTSFRLLRKTRKFGMQNCKKIYDGSLQNKFGSRKELCKRVCKRNYNAYAYAKAAEV